MFLPPLIALDAIDRDELNRCLIAWQHKMGPWERPQNFPEWFHGVRHNGELVAVLAAAALIKEPVAGLTRADAIELGRVCATRPALNRAAVRLWREFVFPSLCAVNGHTWVVSYQDAVMHTGGLYRFDGWVRLGTSRSGTDPRALGGGRTGRSKVIWGFSHDNNAMAARVAETPARDSIEAAA